MGWPMVRLGFDGTYDNRPVPQLRLSSASAVDRCLCRLLALFCLHRVASTPSAVLADDALTARSGGARNGA